MCNNRLTGFIRTGEYRQIINNLPAVGKPQHQPQYSITNNNNMKNVYEYKKIVKKELENGIKPLPLPS